MRIASLVALIAALAAGVWMYSKQTAPLGTSAGGSTPTAVIDTVGVKTDLLSIAGAERQQLALEGKYLTLAELRAKGVTVPERRGPYVYSADVSDSTFTITATYTGQASGKAPPTLTIGPDMQVK